jgi:hypothetical protein
MVAKGPSRAQIEKKETPQSGTPASDAVLDGLKGVTNPPSRAQVEKKGLP